MAIAAGPYLAAAAEAVAAGLPMPDLTVAKPKPPPSLLPDSLFVRASEAPVMLATARAAYACKRQFMEEQRQAAAFAQGAWDVDRGARGHCRHTNTDRQTLSDKKWEGLAWLSRKEMDTTASSRRQGGVSNNAGDNDGAADTNGVGNGNDDVEAPCKQQLLSLAKPTLLDPYYNPFTDAALAAYCASRGLDIPPRPEDPVAGEGGIDHDDDCDIAETIEDSVEVSGNVGAGTNTSTSNSTGIVASAKRGGRKVSSRAKAAMLSSRTWAFDPASWAWVLMDRPVVVRVGRFFAYRQLPCKQVQLLRTLLPVLTDAFLTQELIPRLTWEHPVSLRLIDWLVVGYARAKNVTYEWKVNGQSQIVVVHDVYSRYLNVYRRRHFDPFCRRLRVHFELEGVTYTTTVAQLNFFNMARMYGILKYAEVHRASIEAHMKATIAATTAAKEQARKEGRQYRRKPLVQAVQPRAFMCKGFRVMGEDLEDSDDSEGEDDDEYEKEEDSDNESLSDEQAADNPNETTTNPLLAEEHEA